MAPGELLPFTGPDQPAPPVETGGNSILAGAFGSAGRQVSRIGTASAFARASLRRETQAYVIDGNGGSAEQKRVVIRHLHRDPATDGRSFRTGVGAAGMIGAGTFRINIMLACLNNPLCG